MKRIKRKEKKHKFNNIAFLLCFIIIINFCLINQNYYARDVRKCSEIKGHYCTRYEIDKYLNGEKYGKR